MTIDLIFITYNRLEYTKLSLASVLADPTEEFSLTIWDNASTDGTVEYLKNEVKDPRIVDIIFSKENVGQISAMNEIWGKSKADLLGKLDNDCLVTPGWTRLLAQAHEDIAQLGVVACWHYPPEDFDYERAKHKIHTFNGHKIFRHPWTCGTGLLLKRGTFKKFGPIIGRGTTQYLLRIALAGYINGFYYPLIYQEHMDDPKSSYCVIKNKESFDRAINTTVGLQAGRYHDPMGRLRWREEIVRNLLNDPYDPHYYVGWKRKLRKLKSLMREFITGSASKKII
jgi:glycosyltransferase involved in cell wall biosynthesis